MKHAIWFRISGIIFALIQYTNSPAQTSLPADTATYFLAPVIVSPTQATGRETPVTFSNVDHDQLLEQYSVQDVPVLLSGLPSSTFYSENGNGIGYNYLTLRGFDQRRLSVMVNGVPQNDPEDHSVYWIDFPDLLGSTDNIQVQRGAGSAFYGPPAIGGSINLVTNPFGPGEGFNLESVLGFQQFSDSARSFPLSTQKYTAAFRSGLLDGHYMMYGKFGRLLSEGYRQNSWVRMSSYFIGLMKIDGDMTTRIHLFGGPIRDALTYNGLPRFVSGRPAERRQNLSSWEPDSTGTAFGYIQPRRPEEVEEFSQPHYELLHEWKINQHLTLFNTLFYYEGSGAYDYDASWADTSMLRIGTAYNLPVPGNPANTLVRAFVGNRQGGWLPRIELTHAAGRLVLGAELRMHRSVHWGRIQSADGLPIGFPGDYHFYEYNGERDIVSLYAQELFQPAENTALLANLQATYNRYGIDHEKYLGNTFSVPYFFLNPRIGININLTGHWNTYLSLALTSREPRMRNLYAAEDSYFGARPQFAADTSQGSVRYNFESPLARPERLLNLEYGAGYRDATSFISANIYWMEFENELVRNGQVDIFGQAVTGNADRSRHLGIELQGTIGLPSRLLLEGNVTVSRNRLIRYTVVDGAGMKTALDGNPIAGFPGLLGNLRLSYRQSPATLWLSGKYVGGFYTDNSESSDNYNDAYTVFDAGALVQLPRMLGLSPTLRAEVHNVLNALYFAGGDGSAFYPAAERNILIGVNLTQ